MCALNAVEILSSRVGGRRNTVALTPADMPFRKLLLLLVLLLPTIVTAQSVCPKDEDSCGFLGSGSNAGNKCFYFRNGDVVEKNEDTESPFFDPAPDSCGTVSIQ